MRHLDRRTFLKGVGLSMGLPMLDIMSTARAAEAAAAAVRIAFVFFPNGAIMPSWRPKGEGKDYELSETLKGIAEYRDDFNVFTGLAQDNGRAKGDGPGDHARCASTYLTGAHPYKTSKADIRVGISVDQICADRVGSQTKLPSLELGLERGRNAGNCDSGYSCAYSNNISWKTATTPVAKEINPRLVFERLFGAKDAEKGRAERDFYRKSVLDLVAADARKLQKELGATDQRKLEEYFTSVRELEQRIERAERHSQAARPNFKVPDGIPGDLSEYTRLMYDLMVLAFQSNSTRISTFMLGNAGSNRAYRMVGVNEGHHQLSHHRNEKEKVDKLRKVDKFLMSNFAYFLKRLKSIKEGERTLLDNSMIMYGSGLSDGNRHRHDDLPIVIAGKAGGTIDTGRHIDVKREIPLNNLFLSMLDRMGAKVEKLGDSSGRLSQMTV